MVKRIGLIAGPLAAVGAYLLLPRAVLDDAGAVQSGLTGAGRATAAVAVLMAVWWLSEAIDLSVTALVPIALFPLVGASAIGQATAPYADKVIFLFLGGFVLALGMERWGLHKRIALRTILLVGTKPRTLIGGFMVATAVLSMWVSNTATAAMMYPIGISVIHLVFSRMGKEYDPVRTPGSGVEGANFATCLMLGIAYAATIGGVGTLIGTPPNVVLAGYIERTYGVRVSFVGWMTFGVPIVCVMLPLTWFYLTRIVFPVRLKEIAGGREMIAGELRALGPMRPAEWVVMIVFLLTAAAWILHTPIADATGFYREAADGKRTYFLSDEGIAIMAAIALFIIPVDRKRGAMAMDWATASRLPWGILLLFGGGLSLAAAIQANGVDAFIGRAFGVLEGVHPFIIIGSVAVVVVFLTELTSNTAVTNALMPVLGGAGAAAALGVDAELLLIPAAVAASLAFMLPVGTPPNAIVFGSGYVRLPQMVKAGFGLNLLSVAVVTLFCYFLAERLLALNLGG